MKLSLLPYLLVLSLLAACVAPGTSPASTSAPAAGGELKVEIVNRYPPGPDPETVKLSWGRWAAGWTVNHDSSGAWNATLETGGVALQLDCDVYNLPSRVVCTGNHSALNYDGPVPVTWKATYPNGGIAFVTYMVDGGMYLEPQPLSVTP